MRTTGITRRIDELGRVVIPKEIRRNMKLREGEEMEIFVDEGKLILQKFSKLAHLKNYSDEVAVSLADVTGCTALITDLDEIVSAAGEYRRDYAGKTVMRQVTKLFYERVSRTLMHSDTVAVTGEDTNNFSMQIFVPINVAGDVAGGVILLSESDESVGVRLKTAELSAGILGGLLE